MAGNFGETAAVTAARRLEVLGRGQELSELEEAYAALADALGRLAPALARLRDEGEAR
jgi:hypothetical protein